MTTAGDILKNSLAAMGADCWAYIDISDGKTCVYDRDTPDIARPAWLDGEESELINNGVYDYYTKWFVLPDGWEWHDWSQEEPEDSLGCFDLRDKVCVFTELDRWYWHISYESPSEWKEVKTAPDAFRAAQKWVDGQTTQGKESDDIDT